MPTMTIQPEQLKKLRFDKPISLVADHGVYLVNMGISGTAAYVKGCNPNVDDFDDWWGRKNYLMGGGDDEAILLGDLSQFTPERSLKISLGAKSISVTQ